MSDPLGYEDKKAGEFNRSFYCGNNYARMTVIKILSILIGEKRGFSSANGPSQREPLKYTFGQNYRHLWQLQIVGLICIVFSK